MSGDRARRQESKREDRAWETYLESGEKREAIKGSEGLSEKVIKTRQNK